MKKLIWEVSIALGVALAAAPAGFSAGLLRPVDAAYGDLEIREHKVKVVINNGFARTEVGQVFHNPHGMDMEAVYTFPIPEEASMSELSLWIDGKEVIGEVLPKDKARAAYEEEKSEGRAAALNELDGYKAFQIRVSPVRAGQDARVRLVYYQPLDLDTGIGRYVYPLEEGGTDDARAAEFFLNDAVAGEAAFSITATLKTSYPVEAVLVPSHPDALVSKLSEGVYEVAITSPGPAALRRDFVINYRLAADRKAGFELIPYKAAPDQEGTFMLVVTPGMDLKPITGGSDWTFVLDLSGSMADKLAALSEGVEKALGRLRPDDRFRVVLFNQDARWLIEPFTAAAPENVHKAIEAVRRLRAEGSTNLYAGLELGLSGLSEDRTSAVLLVSDGVANTGVTDSRAFLELMRQKDVRLFTFVMGNAANRPLLEGLARISNGFAVSSSNADSIVGKILLAKSKLTHEAIHGVKVGVEGVKTAELTPSRPLTLYRGDQLVVFGRYRGSGKGAVSFTAKVSGKPLVVKVPVTFPEVDDRNPEIERLWALARIREFEHEARSGGDAKELAAAIRDLGMRYSLVTEHTSMIVMNDTQFERRKIDCINAARVGRDRAAQARRTSVPAVGGPPDHSPQSPPDWKAPRLGGGRGGGGSVGPLFIMLCALAAVFGGRRRRDE